MRIPIIATLLLLTALAVLGWRNHRKITALQETHDTLAAQTQARGIFPDPDHPAKLLRSTKNPRQDPEAEARRIAAEFVAYATEMVALGKGISSADEATRRRMMKQMDEIMALNGAQLKILINEILADEADDLLRGNLVNFLLQRLTSDHPREALELLTSSPDLIALTDQKYSRTSKNLIGTAIKRWAFLNPAQALAWFGEHRDQLPESAKFSLVDGVAGTDLRMGLELRDEFGIEPIGIPRLMEAHRKNPAQRNAALTALREWSTTLSDDETREKVYRKSIISLTLGGDSQSADFQSTTEWLETADLSLKELSFLARTDQLDLSYYIKPEDGGSWIAWLGRTFPIDETRQRISQLTTSSRTAEAIEQWLATAPDGPTRHVAIRAYAREKKNRDHDLAVSLAVTLPDGADRDDILRRLHREWPGNEPASQEAAKAFAREHGIESP